MSERSPTFFTDFKNFLKSFINPYRPIHYRDDQKHVMTSDEAQDQASDESFPASDSSGHISKSSEDRRLH